MSPEQARGLEVDARTDLWSLGAVMYELITGHPPFDATTTSDVVSMILKTEPQPIARFARGVPDSLEWLVMKALVKNRDARYQTARELLFDIERMERQLALEAELGDRDASISDGLVRGRPSRTSAKEIESQMMRSMNRSSSLEYLVTEIRAHKKGTAIALAMIASILVTGAYFFWRIIRSPKSPVSPQRVLARLTFGPGLQTDPAWSPDGRFIAYASDRAGNFDIWVQPVGGGDPVQVTRSPSPEWQPDWSPDGNNIVFRAEGEGGGLFVVPAFGGRERKISSFGYRPRWSPDGRKILFLTPGEKVNEYPNVYVSNLDETSPAEISTSVSTNPSDAKMIVEWHPDGQRVSFLSDDAGFWTTSISGGKPVRSEVATRVANELKDLDITLGNFRWAPDASALFFEGQSRGVTNIWRITVEPQSLAWIDGPVRLTTGSGSDVDIALSHDGKHLAFATTTASTRIWSLPFDPVSGKLKGNGEPITSADLDAWEPAVSPDGSALVFDARRHGANREELWQMSLKDRSVRVLTGDDYSRFAPQWSPDGKQIVYTRYRPSEPESQRAYPIVLMPAGGGEEQLLTTPGRSRDYVSDWSPDGQSILASTNRSSKNLYQVGIFPLNTAPHAETSVRIIAADDHHDLWGSRFSPDGQWICYLAQQEDNRGASFLNVLSLASGTSWRITGEKSWCDKPRWAPDGKTIYFITNHDSIFLNVWGIHFDPANGRVVGEPFRVTSFESPSLALLTSIRHLRITFDPTHLYFPLTEVAGSVWTLSDVNR